jgi:1-acyl-sn-glycerol-3-phosphate acyltransferase
MIGWQVDGTLPDDVKKCIVIMAPHTSNWDFIMGWIGYSSLGLDSKYLIKKEAFVFPLGPIIKLLGGIPIDRKNSTSAIQQVSELFRKNEELIITITPEGTRALNRQWKRGFYYIAEHANIPLALGFLDYKNKRGGIGPIVQISGDYKTDMQLIEVFYKDKTARFPENFNLSPQNLQQKNEKIT